METGLTEIRTFRVRCDGDKITTQLLQIGDYDNCGEVRNDRLYSIKKHDPVSCQIDIIEFINKWRDVPQKEVDDAFIQCNLRYPTIEELLYFGIQYPEEHKLRPIVFLIRMDFSGYKYVNALILDYQENCKSIFVSPVGKSWKKECVFAGVRQT